MAREHRESSPRVAIVSTSINPKPVSYAAWAKQGDLLVAGDRNAPTELAEYVKAIGGEYLTPEEQDYWPFSEAIGWNTIQRRNAAVMTAYARQYDFVVTVDDDNYPTHDWVREHIDHLRGDLPGGTLIATGDENWVNPGEFVTPITNQRGVPLGSVRIHTLDQMNEDYRESAVVSQAQILGDPDCDAVTRLVRNPKVVGVNHNVVVSFYDWTAFNSQATVWNGRWAPFIACIPHVGRYDDIIASYIAKRVMMTFEKTVYVGEPAVVQERNAHDIVSDLRNEYTGMQATPYIIAALAAAEIDHEMSLPDAYGACIGALIAHNALPPASLEFAKHWLESWRRYHW